MQQDVQHSVGEFPTEVTPGSFLVNGSATSGAMSNECCGLSLAEHLLPDLGREGGVKWSSSDLIYCSQPSV